MLHRSNASATNKKPGRFWRRVQKSVVTKFVYFLTKTLKRKIGGFTNDTRFSPLKPLISHEVNPRFCARICGSNRATICGCQASVDMSVEEERPKPDDDVDVVVGIDGMRLSVCSASE